MKIKEIFAVLILASLALCAEFDFECTGCKQNLTSINMNSMYLVENPNSVKITYNIDVTDFTPGGIFSLKIHNDTEILRKTCSFVFSDDKETDTYACEDPNAPFQQKINSDHFSITLSVATKLNPLPMVMGIIPTDYDFPIFIDVNYPAFVSEISYEGDIAVKSNARLYLANQNDDFIRRDGNSFVYYFYKEFSKKDTSFAKNLIFQHMDNEQTLVPLLWALMGAIVSLTIEYTGIFLYEKYKKLKKKK